MCKTAKILIENQETKSIGNNNIELENTYKIVKEIDEKDDRIYKKIIQTYLISYIVPDGQYQNQEEQPACFGRLLNTT